jgi:predicted outer membrane protein
MRNRLFFSVVLFTLSTSVLAAEVSVTRVFSRLHAMNLEQIRASELGKSKATDHQVREYAAMLVRAHQDADKELKTFAKQKRIQIKPFTAQSDSERQEIFQDKAVQQTLREVPRSVEFDRYFISTMLQSHETFAGIVSQARDATRDRDVAAFLGNLIPELWRDRQLAASIQASEYADRTSRAPAQTHE